jgi:plastocyanin
VLAVGAAFAINAMNDTGSQAATKYTVNAGGGGRGIAVEMFRPKDILIHAGDTVEWVNPYEEIHTVTFLAAGQKAPDLIVPLGAPPKNGPPTLIFNPEVAFPTQGASYTSGYANSGIIGKGQSFALTFPNLGTYNFLCILHPGMVGSVQVLDAGTTVPSQAAYDADAKASLDKAINAGVASAAATKPANTKNTNGTTNFGVAIPASVGQSDVMQFAPVTLNIGLGDSVTWTNSTAVPHTVTYTAGAPVPELAVPTPSGAGGPPNLVINPQALFPIPSQGAFTGTSFVKSGFLGTGPEATAGTTFSLTFNKAGSYLFICALHADQGMTSLITVGSTGSGGGGTVSPPSTGEAGLVDQATSTTTLLYAFAVAVSIGLIAGARLLRTSEV